MSMSTVNGELPVVVLAGSIEPLFDRVAEGLQNVACEVIRFRTDAEFISQTEILTRATVFYGSGYLPVGRAALAAAPRLRAIISPFTGTDGFDEQAASDLGILVGNGQVPENYASMAEATILMILAALHDLIGKHHRLRAQRADSPITGRMLSGKTVGLLGFGRIARAVTERLAPWNVRLLAHTPHPVPTVNVRFVELEELLQASDVLCVLASLNDNTRNLLNAERLAMTKPGSVLVVTSRGGIVDEQAVYELARRGHFLRIALDVFAEEPLPGDSPLRSLDDAVLTPHAIGHTQELASRLPEAGIESIVRVLRGEPPLHVRNPHIESAWRLRWSP